jgi:hypothetical protein
MYKLAGKTKKLQDYRTSAAIKQQSGNKTDVTTPHSFPVNSPCNDFKPRNYLQNDFYMSIIQVMKMINYLVE